MSILMITAFYTAIVERAAGGASVFFPDLPGCTSAGATATEALINAEQALSAHLGQMAEHGEQIPPPTDFASVDRDPVVEEIGRSLIRVELPGDTGALR